MPLIAYPRHQQRQSEHLGHSEVRLTLQIYSHLLLELQASVAEALDRKLAAK
jgi:hypothetical protein